MMVQVAGALLLAISMNSFTSAETGTWWVQQNNQTCLVVQMNIKVNFSYITKENKTKEALYQIPANATKVVDEASSCGKSRDAMKVLWQDDNYFNMEFQSNASKYDLSELTISLNVSKLYLDAEVNQTVVIKYTNELLDIPLNFSYHCNRENQFNATGGNIVVSKVQLEAFKTGNDHTKFSAAKDCDSNIRPDIVPIAVGISLIALIVVVLIAYIVGRRRQQARGYLNI